MYLFHFCLELTICFFVRYFKLIILKSLSYHCRWYAEIQKKNLKIILIEKWSLYWEAELSPLLSILHSVLPGSQSKKGESEREGRKEGEKVGRREGDELHSLYYMTQDNPATLRQELRITILLKVAVLTAWSILHIASAYSSTSLYTNKIYVRAHVLPEIFPRLTYFTLWFITHICS